MATAKALKNDLLITDSDINKLKKFQDTYNQQLRAFVSSDFTQEYSTITPRPGYILARLFLFDVKREPAKGEASKILVTVDTLAKDTSILNHVVPLVKVIHATENDKGISAGQVWTVPPREVMGSRMNKEFAAIMQMQAHTPEGQKLPTTIPQDVADSISALAQNWGGNVLFRPWLVTPEPVDFLTFVLPISKFVTLWDFGQYYKTLEKEA